MISSSPIDAFLEPDVCLRLFECLLHFLWQATLIGLIGFLATNLLRGFSSHFRYRLNLAMLALIVFCMPITYQRISTQPDPTEMGLSEETASQAGKLPKEFDRPQTISKM